MTQIPARRARSASNPAEKPTVSDLFGPNRDAVSRLLAGIDLDAHQAAQAAVALTLARQLDDGAGMATAGIAKQLLATLELIVGPSEDDDDDLVGRLRAPVGDPTV